MSSSKGWPDDSDSMAVDPRELRVGELINEYFDAQRSPTPVSAEDFLRRHSDFADDLRRHFHGLGLIEKMTSSSADDGTLELTASQHIPVAHPAPTPMPTIEGYDVLKEIGRGGMGLVFKAVQKSTKRIVAVKVLIEGHYASDSAQKRFEREIALAAQLRHPNIIPIYDSGAAGGRMFYTMEYIHGLPLAQYVRDRKLPIREKVLLVARICHAISHAHQRGVIHRDLKPSNILVDAEGEPHVHDFGLAKSGSLVDVQLSVTANLVGTPAYMSPEQVSGDPGNIDTRTDIYSLGVILYEVATGQPPYEVSPNIAQTLNNITQAEPYRPSKIDPGVDEDLETIILKALAKNKDDRYQSAAELASDLERFVRGEPIQARPPTSMYLLKKALQRHRREAVIAGIVLVVATIAFFATRSAKTQTQQLAQQLHQKEGELGATTAKLELLQNAIGRMDPESKRQVDDAMEKFVNEAAKAVSGKQPPLAMLPSILESVAGGIARNLPSSQPASEWQNPALDGPRAARGNDDNASAHDGGIDFSTLRFDEARMRDILKMAERDPKLAAAIATLITAGLGAKPSTQSASPPPASQPVTAPASAPAARDPAR